MKKIIFTLGFIISFLISPNLYAEHEQNKSRHNYDRHNGYQHELNKKIEKQHRRIEKGVKEGLLTRGEVDKLEYKHKKLLKTKSKFWLDGHLDRYEQHALNDQLKYIGHAIYDFERNNVRSRNYCPTGTNYAYNSYQNNRPSSRYVNRNYNGSYQQVGFNLRF